MIKNIYKKINFFKNIVLQHFQTLIIETKEAHVVSLVLPAFFLEPVSVEIRKR